MTVRRVDADVLRQIGAATRLFCFLDFDGTLSLLAPAPDRAVPLAGTEDVLRQLVNTSGVAVAIVSGRSVADVRGLLYVPGVYYIGIHGVEVGLPSGELVIAADVAAVHPVIAEIKRQLQERVLGWPGVLLEDKAMALACHYRLASREDAVSAEETMTALVEAHQREGAPIALLRGHEVLEVRPAGVDKGKAVCGVLATYGRGALPVYIGDDRTDEDAFRMVPPESITIRVGPPAVPSSARYRVDGPPEVQCFLRAMVACRVAGAAESLRRE